MRAPGCPVIDFRVRPPYRGFTHLGIFDKRSLASYSRMGVDPSPAFLNSDIDGWANEAEAGGVTASVIVGRNAAQPYGVVPNEDIVSLVEMFPDRVIPFGSIRHDSIAHAVDDVRRIEEEYGFVGVATDPGWLGPPRRADDPTLYPVYARCEERSLPIILGVSAWIGPDVSYSDPATIMRVARDFPDLHLIIGHAGWPYSLGLLGVCFTTKNIWLAPDFYGHVPDMPGKEVYSEAMRYFMGERTLYASAYPARPLGSSIDEFNALALPYEVKRNAFYRNAERLIGERMPAAVARRLRSVEAAG